MASDRDERPQRGAFRILLLEGSMAEAFLVDTILKYTLKRYELTHVTSGKGFAVAAQSVNPDLIISECSLPTYDGRTALVAARALCPSTPFFFYSGTIEEEIGIALLRLGASDYIHKGKPELLISAIERTLIDAEEQDINGAQDRHLQSQTQFLGMAVGAVIFRDSNGGIKFWNTAAEHVFAFSRKGAIGSKGNELLIVTSLDAIAEANRIVQEVGQWKGQLDYRLKTGEAISVMSHWALEKPSIGLLSRALIVETEITVQNATKEVCLHAARRVGTL